ncbi:MAG: hypothetical protein ACXVEE_21960 [Polyangiales bacterium]
MPLIGDEAAARRLARAIASDIALYNEDKLRTGEPIHAEVAEGRELFRARVEPSLFRIYEGEIEHVLGPRMAEAKPVVQLTDYRSAPRPPRLVSEPKPEPGPSPWPERVLLIGLVLFVFALVVWAFLRRR